MGNKIGAALIQALRSSADNTLMIAKTSSFPPVFTEDVPGISRAWVTFYGIKSPPTGSTAALCEIVEKSNVVCVSCTPIRGEYVVEFKPGIFDSNLYKVQGTLHCNGTSPQSAANAFFVKEPGYTGTNIPPITKDRVYIQAYYSPMSQNYALSGGPSYAYKVSLNFTKNYYPV